MADLLLEPSRAGFVKARIALLTGDFTALALDAKEVVLIIEHKVAGIEPITRSAMKSSDDLWRIDRLLIQTSGKWNVTLNVLVTDFDRLVLEGTIDVDP